MSQISLRMSHVIKLMLISHSNFVVSPVCHFSSLPRVASCEHQQQQWVTFSIAWLSHRHHQQRKVHLGPLVFVAVVQLLGVLKFRQKPDESHLTLSGHLSWTEVARWFQKKNSSRKKFGLFKKIKVRRSCCLRTWKKSSNFSIVATFFSPLKLFPIHRAFSRSPSTMAEHKREKRRQWMNGKVCARGRYED